MNFTKIVPFLSPGRLSTCRQGLSGFRASGLAWILGLALLCLDRNALAQVPTITSFTALPGNIVAGQSVSLNWIVSGASGLSLDNRVGTVTGTHLTVSPAVTTTYTLTATNATGTSTAAATVVVGPLPHYEMVYQSTLQGSWMRTAWEDGFKPIFTDFAAAAPGRPGRAIEVHFGTNDGYRAFGLLDAIDGWIYQYKYLNEFRTLEFDIYFEADSTKLENLQFLLEDGGVTDDAYLVDLIPGWAGLAETERYGRWFHVAIDLRQLHPRAPRFVRFLLFNNSRGESDGRPHFRMMDVKLGWLEDTTPPVVTLASALVNPTYTQLALAFTTDEPTLFRVEYGVTNYANVIQGPADDWRANHSVTLTNLVPGTTVQYRIVALDHRTDPTALPNPGIYTSTFATPPIPVTPPMISGLTAGGVLGYRATVMWSTDRPCTAQLTYRKSGGADSVLYNM